MRFAFSNAECRPSALREAHLDSLPEPQIHHMERLASSAQIVLIVSHGETVGYVGVNKECVVEFYLTDAALPWRSDAFYAAAEHTGARSALVKSFDALTLSTIAEREVKARVVGVNFMTFDESTFVPRPEITARSAERSDASSVREIAADLYEDAAEIDHHIAARELLMFESGATLVGCGFVTRIRPNRNAFDIGMAVAPGFRRRGIGEYIVRHLRRHCVTTLDGRPIAGCAMENIASRRTLEKSGFISHHSLMELSW